MEFSVAIYCMRFQVTAILAGSEGPKISLRIDKAILNYKKPVDKPTFAVSIVNSWGEAIGEPLQTPPGSFDRDSGIITFGHTMVLPQGIHKISDGKPWMKPRIIVDYLEYPFSA